MYYIKSISVFQTKLLFLPSKSYFPLKKFLDLGIWILYAITIISYVCPVSSLLNMLLKGMYDILLLYAVRVEESFPLALFDS